MKTRYGHAGAPGAAGAEKTPLAMKGTKRRRLERSMVICFLWSGLGEESWKMEIAFLS